MSENTENTRSVDDLAAEALAFIDGISRTEEQRAAARESVSELVALAQREDDWRNELAERVERAERRASDAEALVGTLTQENERLRVETRNQRHFAETNADSYEAAEAALAEAREEAAFWKGTADTMAEEEVPALVKRYQRRVRDSETALADMRRALEEEMGGPATVKILAAISYESYERLPAHAKGRVDRARRALAAAVPAPEKLGTRRMEVDGITYHIPSRSGPAPEHRGSCRIHYAENVCTCGAPPPEDNCPECGSGILNGEHIANYPCSRRESK